MSFRVCIACYGIRVYPYVGFMTGQRYQCQDCLELMVIPLEFENEVDCLFNADLSLKAGCFESIVGHVLDKISFSVRNQSCKQSSLVDT